MSQSAENSIIIFAYFAEITNEAIKRRKELRPTQKQLAVLAGVSGPTVNGFEQGKRNFTLESCLEVLRCLGLSS